MNPGPKLPVVLVIAGNDPSGGAGICADLQAISVLGCHPAPVITALTVQDTRNAYRVENVACEFVSAQARAVLDDMPVAAIKLGLLGSQSTGLAVATLLADYPEIPKVIDPVLVATGGASLAESGLVDTYLDAILEHATVATPNAEELRQLGAPADALSAQVERILSTGCQFVLCTGGDAETPEVHNHLFGRDQAMREFTWPRIQGKFHGSGCTLASAIAALLARGETVEAAVEQAQDFTAQAIREAWQPGRGQKIPNRFHSS